MKAYILIIFLFLSSLAHAQSSKEVYLEALNPKVMTDEDIKNAVLVNFKDIITILKRRNILNQNAEVSDPTVDLSSDLSSISEPLRSRATHMVYIYFFANRRNIHNICKFKAPFEGGNMIGQLSNEQLDSFLSCRPLN